MDLNNFQSLIKSLQEDPDIIQELLIQLDVVSDLTVPPVVTATSSIADSLIEVLVPIGRKFADASVHLSDYRFKEYKKLFTEEQAFQLLLADKFVFSETLKGLKK